MRKLEAALKAAADPNRTRILKLLDQRELCVCQIQAVLRLAPSTISKHLFILKSAGLVDDRRDGRWIHYGVATQSDNPHAEGVLSLLRRALDRDPKIVEDRRRLNQVLRVPVAELCAAMPFERAAAPLPASRGRATRRTRVDA